MALLKSLTRKTPFCLFHWFCPVFTRGKFLSWKHLSTPDVDGNYSLLTGRHLCHYLMERIMALRKSLTRKTPFCLFHWFCPVFTRGKFCLQQLEDCPISGKICNIVINHPHLLSIDDDRKFVYIYSFFTSADWLLYSLYLQI